MSIVIEIDIFLFYFSQNPIPIMQFLIKNKGRSIERVRKTEF